MSDNEMTEMPAELQALYEAERARPDPAPGDKDAVYTALAASCGVAAVAAGVSTVGAGAAAGSSGATAGVSTGAAVASGTAGISGTLPAMLIKPVTLLVFAAGAATGTGTTLLVEHVATSSEKVSPGLTVSRRAPARRPVTPPPRDLVKPPVPQAPAVAVLEPPTEAVTAPQEPPRPAAKPAAPPRKRRVAPVRSPSPKTSAVERNLLERARTALSRGEAAAALRALQQHRKKYPRGTLAEERGALMVVALADLGKRTRARTAARQFKKRYPHSLLLPLVEDALKRAKDPR